MKNENFDLKILGLRRYWRCMDPLFERYLKTNKTFPKDFTNISFRSDLEKLLKTQLLHIKEKAKNQFFYWFTSNVDFVNFIY